jgi:hypothetical protein
MLHILVKFEHATDKLTIEIDETSDPEALRQAWSYIAQASKVRQHALDQGIPLDQIRILPDSSRRMLVIGYQGVRPTHVIDLLISA